MTVSCPEDLGQACRASVLCEPILVRPRSFNRIEVDRARGVLTKTSSDNEKLIQEIEWYQGLPDDLRCYVPELVGSSRDGESAFAELEYVPWTTLHNLLVDGVRADEVWTKAFCCLRSVLDAFGRHERSFSADDRRASMAEMNISKTVRRVDRLRECVLIRPFFEREFVLNGAPYPSLSEVLDLVPSACARLCDSDSPFVIVHGDLTFSNVLIDSSLERVKLIDPRGVFGCTGMYGDARFELAKLLQCVDGCLCHIVEDEYDLRIEGRSVWLHVRHRGVEDIRKLFWECFADRVGGCVGDVRLMASLLYMAASALHRECPERQVVLMMTGVEMFFECLSGSGL